MGGIIEDKIFDALGDKRLTVTETVQALKDLRPAYHRARGTIYNHMKKMFILKQLERSKNSNGRIVYWAR